MPPDSLTLRAPAKINLSLRVTGRRPDGYHTLDTLMQKVALYDRLVLRPKKRGIRLSCPDSDLPEDDSNLVHRAAAHFLSSMGHRLSGTAQGVELVLFKTIPVAAGLGGGSSDAAATLLGMNRIFQAGCSRRELAEMGLALGADVPFFVSDLAAARATGIGEVLVPAPSLEGYLVLLANPGFSVSTRWVYETFALTSETKKINLSNSLDDERRSKQGGPSSGRCDYHFEMTNDLERVTISRHPGISEIKQALLAGGAEAAMMSGSGPTVFALFPLQQLERARKCQHTLRASCPHVFLVEPLRSERGG